MTEEQIREWDKFSEICERDFGVKATGILWENKHLYLLDEKVEITPEQYNKIYEEVKREHL